eukprot:scaffold2183_cov140-Isochrysis_galbana.AAC.19
MAYCSGLKITTRHPKRRTFHVHVSSVVGVGVIILAACVESKSVSIKCFQGTPCLLHRLHLEALEDLFSWTLCINSSSGPCPHTRCVVSVGLACDLKISQGQCARSFRALCPLFVFRRPPNDAHLSTATPGTCLPTRHEALSDSELSVMSGDNRLG